MDRRSALACLLAASCTGWGRSHGEALIARYKARLGHSRRGRAWCAAFLNEQLHAIGLRGTGSNLAHSFLRYGTAVAHPQRGDLVISRRRGGGHVSIFLERRGNIIIVISANWGRRVAVHPVSGVIGYRRV